MVSTDDEVEALSSRIVTMAFAGQPQLAAQLATFARASSPHSHPLKRSQAIADLVLGKASALDALEEALASRPDDVLARAYYGAGLRALGRTGQAGELFDFANLVKAASIPAFSPEHNAQLEDFILEHPTLERDPAGKATKGGWQTGELFLDPSPLASTLETHFRARIAETLGSAVPPFKLVGWAVVLEAGGHQGPHIHPAGILSGVYYVKVPGGLSGDQGALRFTPGVPWLGPPIPRQALHDVSPAAGLLVTFPSYFWHQTVPFTASGKRICVSFDVVPAARVADYA